jgi:hypothetical protein
MFPRTALAGTSLRRASLRPLQVSGARISQVRAVSTGTSRNETHEEQAKAFSNQSNLPRLPVPDLEQSLKGYLESLKPILEQKVSLNVMKQGALGLEDVFGIGAIGLVES